MPCTRAPLLRFSLYARSQRDFVYIPACSNAMTKSNVHMESRKTHGKVKVYLVQSFLHHLMDVRFLYRDRTIESNLNNIWELDA